MPRLSLYKPEKGKDYEFLDRQILEMFTVGGTDILIHKYIGTDDGTTVKDETQIQDVMFGENRDRRYEPDIYTHRAIYNVQDLDFNLSQFGLFLTNDTLFMTIHIRSSVKTIGRKIMSGDVIELPHLKDEYALNDYSMALKRFYVVEEVTRAAEGFSQTWYPHLYRLKLKQIYDGQEYKDILDLPADEESPGGPKLRDFLSTYEREMQINDAILEEAISETQQSGYDTNHFFTLQTDSEGKTELTQVQNPDGFSEMAKPDRPGYQGYLIGTLAPNGEVFGHGIAFPSTPQDGDYFLRTDFLPNRLFKYKNSRWNKVQDLRRADMIGADTANNQKGDFINNSSTSTVAGETFDQRQALSKALRPKADN